MQSAVEELHRLGFALDLRVPNICFEKIDGQWQAVLIDLDYFCDIKDPKPVEKEDLQCTALTLIESNSITGTNHG